VGRLVLGIGELREADRPMSMTAATSCTGDAVMWALRRTDFNNPVPVASFRSTKDLCSRQSRQILSVKFFVRIILQNFIGHPT
jgi:hypothetical protein